MRAIQIIIFLILLSSIVSADDKNRVFKRINKVAITAFPAGTRNYDMYLVSSDTLGNTDELFQYFSGARFGNAIASLGCHPAEVTVEAGIDMLSFGASKNGCMAAEALIIFGQPQWRETAERLRKRSGHLLSKMRYVSAQLLAYIENDRWLEMANHANRQAVKFARAIEHHAEASLEFPVQANEVFMKWTMEGFEQLKAQGIQFEIWPGRNDLARFVFAHSTSGEEVDALVNHLR